MSSITHTRHERRSVRIPVCAAAEVRILETVSGHALTQWAHAVVVDASVGGLKLAFTGAAAEVLSNAGFHRHHAQIRLLPAQLSEFRSIRGVVCWSRNGVEDYAWCIGIQFVDIDARQREQLFKTLVRYGQEPIGRARAWSLSVALLAAIGVGLGIWWQSAELRGGMRQADAHLSETRRNLAACKAMIERGWPAGVKRATHTRRSRE